MAPLRGGGGGARCDVFIYWLVCITALHHVTTGQGDTGTPAAHSFKFTQASYNATIPENAVPKTYVTPSIRMGMQIVDPTLEIRYKIVGGDTNKFFKPEERIVGDFCFLLVRTRTGNFEVINRERQEKYTLNIKAIAKYKNGPTLEARTKIEISVLDANDLSPLFYPRKYDVEVGEDAPLHTSIAVVSASDADIGVNGEMYYSFKRRTDIFAIHPTTGVVSLTRPLNYIEANYYELDIEAVDRGAKLGALSRKSNAKLHIRVKQINFHSPDMQVQHLSSLVENGNLGTIYAILIITDKDIGQNGQIGSVEITSGDYDGDFTIMKGRNHHEYNLQVVRTLDREFRPYGYNLTIRVTDRGTPPKSIEQLVHIKIIDTNDHAPKLPNMYAAEIEETVPVFYPVLFINATDKDYGRNAEIAYKITSGNERGWFAIGKRSGLLYTSEPLDAEKQEDMMLTVSAQDQGNTGARIISRTKVKIKILDCNDNNPVFNNSKATVSLLETQAAGTLVYTVSATDADKGENGFLRYSIANVNPHPFEINHFSGEIHSTKELDYESARRLYKLRIRASDWGAPYSRESEMLLRVKLRDVNDNKPQFEKVDCVGFLSREAPIGTQLVVVSAIDFDTGNIISYKIISGNEDNCFELLSSTGALKLKCDLTDSPTDFRSIFLTASDGVNTADPTSINITLVNNNRNRQLSNNDASISCHSTDVTKKLSDLLGESELNNQNERDEPDVMDIFTNNRNTPEFVAGTPRVIEVQEGLSIGSVVYKLKATDDDPGYNGKLVYVISSGSENGAFKMNTNTGELVVMGEVDREEKDQYMLNITVADLGQPPLSSSTILTVNILDVNDNAPHFEKNHYDAVISESVIVGTNLMAISATDRDLGTNADIRYAMITDTQDFVIDPKTGVLGVKHALDREVRSKYELVIKASDGSVENPLSSMVPVTITLTDVNDNAPRFTPASYEVHIREDLPIGTVVMTITAHDPDLGSGGVVRYSLIDGIDDKFEIDRQTGTIRIAKKLDYESKQAYNITGRARDRGDPPLFSRCHIFIEIIDVNENLYAPVFDDFVISGSVKESEPLGTTVMQIEARDKDSKNPAASSDDYRITYSIRNGTGLGRFTINNKGIIRTSEVLDRETTPHYWLTVYAQDHGAVPLHSTIEVFIEVEDVNDNVPLTVEPVYYPTVPENSKEGTSVVKIMAFDADENASKRLTYRITSGNPQGFFSINEATGLISTTKRRLDRERQDEHILEVTVSDNGIPSLSSTTRVVVQVEDINDQAPVFTERLYRIRIPEMKAAISQPIYRVVAHDKDIGSNADIDFSIKSGKGNGRFKINPKNGIIYATRDFIAGTEFDLTLKANDNGRPMKRGTARVRFTVVAIPRNSTRAPEFVTPNHHVTVMENDAVGRMVCIMSAEDPDGDKIWYSILDGNDDDTFSIDTENGNIVLARALDWEKQRFYNLSLMATDGVLKSYTMAYVEVLDINDNRPKFLNAAYVAEINENTTPGTDILQVTAVDDDEDKRLFYTIHSTTHRSSRSKFRVNSESGYISVAEPLDREAISQHELTIMVRDQGTPSKRSLTRVLIKISDHNDHTPKFLSRTFQGRVFETAAIGTSVVQVFAVDKDKGKNAEISFYIKSGNVGSVFTIDEALGVISVAKQLDRSSQSEYSMTVMASDHGDPSLSSTAKVQVNVTISNNAPPKFMTTEYTTEIYENERIGSYVIAVSAKSRSSVTYEIVGGNDDEFFMINPNSGVISTNIIFDYEKITFANLTVRAINMVHAYADAHVMIHIIDVNDNHPKFLQREYVGNISESAPAGSVILDKTNSPLVVRARDNDTDLSALMVYSIMEQSAQEVFTIDANTGAIRTRVSLDHEVQSNYSFTVQVTDMGTPRLSALEPALVIINVMDINDSPPAFSQQVYEAQLLLPTYMDVTVIQVQAHDADSASWSDLVYSITAGNTGKHFAINAKTGMITVVNVDKMQRSYELTVHVSDGKFHNTAQVVISVLFTQDSGLRFSKEEYVAEIMENQTRIERITMVQALGSALNEHLEFSILNPNNMFNIGKTSGVLQTVGAPFDREVQDQYDIVVEVRDNRTPPRVSHVIVKVNILDMNDNSPVFVNQPYYAVVSIDARKNDIVKQVSAIDRDVGENGQVHYRLLSGDEGKFKIEEGSGEISVRRPLESTDQNREYMLIVEASDSGEEPKKTTTSVPIKIMNKATPVFDKPFYSISVPENIQTHTAIISIEAHSPHGRKLIYSITKGDIYDEFAVDFNTGVIQCVDELDYELRKHYDLTVRATDTFTGSWAEATVTIRLEDVNDKAPSFESQLYMSTISEAVSIGTSIMTISAHDDDSGMNSNFYYQMEENEPGKNDTNYFHIDSVKGIILTKQNLDHEKRKVHKFNIIATDHGMPALSASVPVTIIVTDLNDNAPKFNQPSYDCTITDQVKRGQFVTMVTASDDDSADAGELIYSIVAGNENHAFAIDHSSGIISLSSLRKPHLGAYYMLNVSVTDGVFTNFARVRINVKNSNRHSPQFTNRLYIINMEESLPIGQDVVRVLAKDADEGKFGQVEYIIPSDYMGTMFSIDKASGEIRTKAVLHREFQHVYEVPVIAQDRGGRAGHATVRVHLTDVNDNKPVFKVEEFKANVYSNASYGDLIVMATATDKDSGRNGDMVYSIVDGKDAMASKLFDINKNTGALVVKANLSESDNQLIQFFIKATDKGKPPLDSNVGVEVYIMSPQDTPPYFDQKSYAYFIPEERPLGSVIATVTAYSNETLVYSIVTGTNPQTNNPEVFSISQLGKITLTGDLDHEKITSYVLTIRAETETSPPLVAYTEVTVQIMDVNDNVPVFESNPYIVSLAEHVNIGSKVIKVKANDNDTGSNADVTYHFSPLVGKLANVFALDTNSGWITTLVKLDREKTDKYDLEVVSTDRGQVKLSGTTTVRITVLDHNDEAPVFSQTKYVGAVNEDALPGTIIVPVTSVDQDLRTNADVAYYLTKGDPLGQFSVRNTGEIFVAKALDRESKAFYAMEVTATDGAFVSTAEVEISILDANDNAPVCEQTMYQTIINEDVPVGAFIAHTKAQDDDEADTRNTRLQYSITGDGAYMFNMHRKSGIIVTMRPLDRERKPEYHLTLRAEDGGGLFCTAEVYITLSDVNDNAPTFTMQQYTVAIPENAEVNTLLTRVSASDPDLGINRKVVYALEDPGGHFAIDSHSGIISLTKMLDREKQAKFNLTLRATDKGTPKKSSTAYLVILLLDVNDNPPEFESATYTKTVREDVPTGTSIMRVFATSKDTGVNAEIKYTIIAGNEQGNFRVDSKTGAITIINSLDYEIAREYFLTVQASDGGTPTLSNTAIIKINVTDANDNPPHFGQSSYTAQVREDASLSHNIVQVQADDMDSAPNSMVSYAIVSGDVLDQFTINRDDGYISVASELNREQTANYVLEVEARDSGHPQLTSNVMVSIEVLDANDNIPTFTELNYTAVVQVDEKGSPLGVISENRDVGFSIMKITVTDDDIDPNGPPFTYDIIGGNNDNEFRIDNDGTLSTAHRFNRAIKDSYRLIVRVFDNGTPPLYSDTYVNVKIIEESAFPPTIEPLDVSLSSYNDDFPGGVIGRVKASDVDLYDKLTFGIASNNMNLFDIHVQDGTIKAFKGLDAGAYNINVSVTDGKFTVYTTVRLEVLSISEEAAANAVVVRFQNMLPEDFVKTHRRSFIRALKQQLSVRSKDIDIISVQPASSSSSSRSQRSAESDLDILLAVRKSHDNFYSGKALRRMIAQKSENIESAMGVNIVRAFNDICTKDLCGQGKCRTKIVFDKDSVYTILTENQSYVSAKHSLTYECVCKEGRGGPKCETQYDSCAHDPCPSYKVCQEGDAGAYKCVCPEGKVGPRCEKNADIENCVNMECLRGAQKPLTFTHNSYARWKLADSVERRLSLSLEIKTLQARAVVMYVAGRRDYSILEIDDGLIQYKFDLGSGPGLVSIERYPINDGKWHLVGVERRGNNAEILLDGKFHAETSAPGNNDLLNLDNNDVYFGAEVENLAHGYTDIRKGFDGCLKEVKINNVKLPYIGSSPVGTLQKFEKVEFTCREDQYKPGICSSRPCMNLGTCDATGPNSYVCHCQDRFVGSRCEIDTNPCASNPCMYGGECENLPNDFRCKCKGRYTGKRCDYGHYCIPTPCKHGGICTEGPNGPICNCKGFEGDLCERDVDECQQSPCKNGATCHNMHGAFRCNCTPETRGDLCEEISFSQITSNSMNINPEEIIGIAVVAAILLIVVIIFILVVRWRRRKRRRNNANLTDGVPRDSRDVILNCTSDDLMKGRHHHKIKNFEAAAANPNIPPSPRPPPVPTRPASYTPSTQDSLNTLSSLNNFDTVRNYGSAADELETMGNVPIYTQEFLQNLHIPKTTASQAPSLPPPPPSNSGSDTESMQKNYWDMDYPNNLESFSAPKEKNGTIKQMPSHTNAMVAGAVGGSSSPASGSPRSVRTNPAAGGPPLNTGSISSLHVSESEDDMPANQRGKKKVYNWDTSDWAPNPTLPNITELPMKEVPDSPSSSHSRSNESNTHVPTINDLDDDYRNCYPDDSEFLENDDSEYVGDSEYAENEYDNEVDGDDDPNADFPDPPNFEAILGPNGDYDENFQMPQHNYNLHPNHYLPQFRYENGPNGDNDNWPAAAPPRNNGEQNGNLNNRGANRDVDPGNEADDDDVIQYGFPRPVPHPHFQPEDYGNISEFNDFEHSAASAIDDMSVSMGGYTSTNASCSDISGLCEIEDSEMNLSDYDSGDENHSSRLSTLSNSHLHTQV